MTADVGRRSIIVRNVSLASGVPFSLRIELRKSHSWAAHLFFDGLTGGGASADLASLMHGSAAVELRLARTDARKILVESAGLTESGGVRVTIPERVVLAFRRPTDRHGAVDTAASFSLSVEARRGTFHFPFSIRSSGIQLAPIPQMVEPDWRAALVGVVIPEPISLGRGGPTNVELRASSFAVASLVRKPASDGLCLRLSDRMRLDFTTGSRREGPVRCSVADLFEQGDVRSASLSLDPRHWSLETCYGMFGVSGGQPASTGTRSEAYGARIVSKRGHLTLFDVPLGLHEYGVAVPGADLARFDFGGATIRLGLHSPGKVIDGITLPLGTAPKAKFGIPLDRARLRLVEARSLMSLVYRFKGLDLINDGGRHSLEPRPSSGRPDPARSAQDFEDDPASLLVVDFPPQHLMEKAYLKQEAVLPDREIPVAAADLRAVLSGQEGRAAEARARIACAKVHDEACDRGLEGKPEDRPFQRFSALWKLRAKDWPEEIPWIGPMGLLTVRARQAARQCAAEQRATDLKGIADALERPAADPAGRQTSMAAAMTMLGLSNLGLSQSALQIAGERKPDDVDAAVRSMFDAATKASNDKLRELQDEWTLWRKSHPSPVETFVTSQWPVELASQALLDSILPVKLKGKAPQRVPDDTATAFLSYLLRKTADSELADSQAILKLPNECHLSGPSRLAFIVPTRPAKSIALTRAALTDWSKFDLHVVRRAVRWYEDKPQPGKQKRATLKKIDEILAKLNFKVSGDLSLDQWMSTVVADATEPHAFETAIELPARLVMSPAQDVRWITPRGLPPEIARRFEQEGNVAIWQAEYFEADADEPSLRAVWSRDFRREAFTDSVGHKPPEPGPWAPWTIERRVPFRTSVDARDRHELVGLTSLYGLPVLARRDIDGTLHASQARIPSGLKLKGLKDPSDVALYLPQGLAPRRLALSALGGSLDLDATFTPPATTYRDPPDATSRPPATAYGDPAAELYESFGLARFSMQTSYGYDEVVEVVRKGFLMPLGHSAAFVKTTRREIWNGAGPLSYPVQRLTVQVTKSQQLYGRTGQRDKGRGFPAQMIELVTLRTPDLIDPLSEAPPTTLTPDGRLTHNSRGRVGGLVGGSSATGVAPNRAPAGLVFWPRIQSNEAGNVRFRMRVDGSADNVYMPLLFLDNQAAHDAETVRALIEHYYNRDGNTLDHTRWNIVRHGGATRAYGAETKPGETSFPTDWQEVDAEGSDGANPYAFNPTLESLDQPPFFPALRLAQVQAIQIGRLTGLPAPSVQVSFNGGYLERGFEDEAPGRSPVIYLDVVGERPRLDMGKQGDRAGGLGRPSQEVVGFSRAIGPVGRSTKTQSDLYPSFRRVHYAEAHQLLADAIPAGGGAAAPPATFFDDQATLLGIVKLNDLIRILANEAQRNDALPALKEVTEFAEQAGSKALVALELVARRLTKAIDESGARGVGYDTLGKRAAEFDEAVATAKNEPDRGKIAGDLADVWSSGQRLAAELQRLAQAPLAPAIDFFTGQLRQIERDTKNALADFEPVSRARQATAEAIANLASSSDWARNIVSLSVSTGLPAAPANLLVGRIKAAAADPQIWLAPDPGAAIVERVKAGIAPELATMIDADALLGPLWPQFNKLVGKISLRFDQAFSEMQRALQPLITLEQRYTLLATSATKLCLDGTEAARALVAAAMPADAVDPQSMAAITDAVEDVRTLGADLAELVADLPKSDWDKAKPIIDWSEGIRDRVGAASARVMSVAAALKKARSDLVMALGTGTSCPTPGPIASVVDQFEGARRSMAAALSLWGSILAEQVPADPGLAGKAGSRIRQAADKIRKSASAAVSIIQQTTLAATATSSFPSPELQKLLDADAAIRTVLSVEEGGVATAIRNEAYAISQIVDEAADQASNASRFLDDSIKAADQLLVRVAVSRKKLEDETRKLLENLLQAAVSPLAAQVQQALADAFTAAASAAGLLYRQILSSRKNAFDFLEGHNKELEALLGPVQAPGACPGGWAEALLLVSQRGRDPAVACTLDQDALAVEAAEVATPDGFIAAIARWAANVEPAPVALVRQSGRLAETSVRAAVTRLVDVQGLRQELLDALLDIVPLQRRLTYDMALPLQRFDAGFLTLLPEPGGKLVLRSETTIKFDPGSGPGLTSTFSGNLPALAIDVPHVLTVSFDPIRFIGGTGRASVLDAKLKGVKLGRSLDVLQKLEGLLNRGDEGGPYVRLTPENPAIEVGYLLSIGAFTIGNLAFLNINFLAALKLPFDGSDARIHLSLGTVDQPFLLSAAPYGGGGFFGLEAGAGGITASEASFEYGGVAAVAYGPLQAVGRITTGVYVRQSAGSAVLSAIFFAGFSGHIACFGIASSFTLRLAHGDGKLSGTATLEFTFSFGFGHIDFSVRVGRSVDSNLQSAFLVAPEGPTRLASLDTTIVPVGPACVTGGARIVTSCIGAEQDWFAHEAYYDQGLRPAGMF